MMKIAIIGTGYVGLVSGACFAEMGLDITCVDIDHRKIEALNAGRIPIYEPGLEEIVRRNFEAGRLHFTTDLASCLDRVEVVFSAVGTPPAGGRLGRSAAGLRSGSHVRAPHPPLHAARNEEHRTRGYGTKGIRDVIVAAELKARGEEIEFDVASNPEFLKEGCRRQGLHVARPGGGRGRERTGPQADGPALPALPDQQLPRAVHGHRLGRDDQICRPTPCSPRASRS